STITEFSFAGIEGVTSGSASGKLMVLGAMVSLARAATVALIVSTLLSEAARVTAGSAATARSKRAATSFLDILFSIEERGVKPNEPSFRHFGGLAFNS